jgi:hypothetical protein
MLRRLTFLVATTLVAGSCGSDEGPSAERGAQVYGAVIRALVSEPPGHPDTDAEQRDRVVYAGPLGEDVEISLDVQVAVVDQLEQFATIRFVDERNEAIDDDEAGKPVREGGVLLLLGAIPDGRSPAVEATRYIEADVVARFRVAVERSGGKWKAVDVGNLGRRDTASGPEPG